MASSSPSRHGIAQASRLVARAARGPSAITRAGFFFFSSSSSSSSHLVQTPSRRPGALPSPVASRRVFSACTRLRKGIMPDTEIPAKVASARTETARYIVTELSDAEYHEIADEYLDNALAKFEMLQDSREDIDVEFSSGVMTISIPEKGTYVINKQPPNKQIWLSSPISGPKRYDWCVVSEGQGDKEGTGSGYWIYSRDSSSLDELILKEIGVDIEGPVDS